MEKHETSSFEKFTDKAELYAKYRPGYPNGFIEYLCDDIEISPYSIIADIGSGTGILSMILLEQGCKVFCIEPNSSMRRVAEHTLSGFPNFVSVNAMAENTGLSDESIDFITVAQAFHWFDLEKFRQECQRILKPGGKVILVWNSKVEDDPVTMERERICREYCPDFKGSAGGQGTAGLGNAERMKAGPIDRSAERPDNCTAFFRDGIFEMKEFENDFYGDLDSFLGGNLSSSYAPKKSDGNYTAFVESLTDLFHRYSKDGQLLTRNVTRSYVGEV